MNNSMPVKITSTMQWDWQAVTKWITEKGIMDKCGSPRFEFMSSSSISYASLFVIPTDIVLNAHYISVNIDMLGQERHNASALAMELCLSCTNPSQCNAVWEKKYFNLNLNLRVVLGWFLLCKSRYIEGLPLISDCWTVRDPQMPPRDKLWKC